MKALVVGVGVILCAGLAVADPPRPEPKVGSDESLPQNARDPWDEGSSPEQRQAAARLFQDANKDFNDGLGDQAVAKYRKALALWPHPWIHYNLGLALLDLKKPIDSEEQLTKAIAYGLKGLNNQEDKLEQGTRYLKLLADRLATVEVSCQKDGAKVSVDGKVVFSVANGKRTTYRSRVEIGKHTFVAEKPGHVTVVDAPFIGPGETFRIELPLLTTIELTRHKRLWPERTWMPWAVAGAGALVGLVGGALQWSATSDYEEFDQGVARCNMSAGNTGCDVDMEGIAGLRESGDTKRLLGVIGYGLAGATIVTGGLLIYLNRRVAYQITTEQYRMEELQKQKQKPAVTIAPLVAPGLGGVMVLGRF